MAIKYQKIRGRINLSNKEEKSYKNNTTYEINLNQANDEYSLQL